MKMVTVFSFESYNGIRDDFEKGCFGLGEDFGNLVEIGVVGGEHGGYGELALRHLPEDSFEALLGDVPLEISVELGRVTLSLREIASRLGPGSILTLSKLTGEKLDVRINERLVARGEAVAVGERYGIRIVEILGSDEVKT